MGFVWASYMFAGGYSILMYFMFYDMVTDQKRFYHNWRGLNIHLPAYSHVHRRAPGFDHHFLVVPSHEITFWCHSCPWPMLFELLWHRWTCFNTASETDVAFILYIYTEETCTVRQCLLKGIFPYIRLALPELVWGEITRTISNPHMWVVKTMGSCRFLPYIQWYTATLHISSISAENHWAGLGAKEKVYQEKENAPDTFAGGILVESVDQMSHWCCWLVMIYPIHWGLQSSMRGIPINQYDWISWMTQGLEHCDGVLRYPLVRR